MEKVVVVVAPEVVVMLLQWAVAVASAGTVVVAVALGVVAVAPVVVQREAVTAAPPSPQLPGLSRSGCARVERMATSEQHAYATPATCPTQT